MANLSSVEFEGVKCSTVFIAESNDLSTDANEETNASGLFLNPSENVMGRSGDITGYILKSSNNQGKLEWVNPTTEAEYNTVRVATVSNIVITDPISSIDDILLNDEDRVLIKDQTDTTQNGIYVVDNGFFVRPNDAEFGISAFGVYYFVAEGTINYNTVWLCSDYETTFGEPITFNAIRIAGNEDLPAPLESIANLTTFPNEMIYTIAADTYATTALTVVGRSLLLQPTVSEQRSQLGLEIGSDVQAYSSILDNVVAIPSTNDRILYTVGGSYSGTELTAFVRANVLPASDAATLSSNLGYIVGPISTTNRMLKVSASNTVSETGLSVDASNNLTGVNNVTSSGTINGVTTTEFNQLSNIDSTTISNTQWGFLGDMNQGVATTDTPIFNGLNVNSQKITAIAAPTDAQDAANKSYVDTAVASGTTPLTGTNYATTAILPNNPVYASPAETLTSTGGPGSLDIDGQTVFVGDRVLIKNQVDNRENGVYNVTDDGATPGPNWTLTRSLDFNQAATPIPAGSSIFINTVPGASNSASTWTLRTTVNTIDPLTDAVEWIQTGGSVILASGLGIDATQLAGGTIQTDISARLTYSGNDLDLNTVTVPYGGTGLTSITSGNVMVGQGAAAVSATKAAPTGDFIGTTDTQTLTNKTMTSSSNNVTSRALFINSGAGTVSTFTSAAPSSGQLLIATGATTATWQDLDRIVGPVSTVNRVVKVSGVDTVTETGLSIDASDNLTGVNDITSTGTINGVTTTEFLQLANINSTTISTSQWGFVGAMNQGVATTDTPTFNGLSAGSQKITAILDPTNAQDAATKTYVDTVASTGAAPLTSANYATVAVLPNTPTYASPAETLTSTGGPGTLVIDGQTVSLSDRILVKNQADNRENGVYIVSDDGATPGPNWIITRTTDFNQAATPVSAGTSIFIEIVSGASQSGSTWSLQTTVNTIDPLTDSVVWIQTGGSPSFTAGLGIDATQLTLGTIQTDISARLTYTGNDLDLNTITVPYGGTGLTTITSGNVMVGQGAAAVSATKAAPTGDFVGTTDTQMLTNKTMTSSTNDIISRALFVDSGSGQVSTFAAAVPTLGQVLTATGGTTATWQDTGDVTLNGVQTLTNKTMTSNTNDITSRALFVDSGSSQVSTFAAAVPSVGQVLTATGGTTATWQDLDRIVGPLSTVNRVVKVSGTDTVTETGLSIDASDNLTGVNDITSTGTINGVTTTEFLQLANINSTTISTSQWGFVGAMNQGVATTDTPTFTGLSANSQKITTLADPTNAQDAATKTYVDTVAATGSAPLTSANYATAAVLPNSPVYTSPAETITSTGGPGSLTIDGQTVSVSDRILVKNQADNRENGVYIVTDDGATPGPNWVLTRSTDFNQAATPISAGTSIFVEIVLGASQSGSTWSLQTTVNTIDPLTDSILWVQIGGSPSFTAGLGIDATQLAGGVIQTDISARLTYTGNDLDLNTVTVPFGGTGLTTITSGNVMVGQGTSSISATKAAPTGDFVGTTDTQTLTNKTMTSNTNDITSRALFVDSGSGQVSTFAAAVPTLGQVLTATGGTTATWQDTGDVTLNGVQTLTNKTMTSSTNDITSRALFVDSGSGQVSTFAAAVPSVGQVLTATGGTTATWQNTGDVTLNGVQTLTNKTMTSSTNDITSRALFVDSGSGQVSTFTSAVPSVGQLLIATGATTATWQDLDRIVGPVSTVNRVVKVSGTDTVTETGLSIDASDNLTGVNDITSTGTINGVTTTEFLQLANINSTTISTSQWGFVGTMNQGVATTDTPTFTGLSANSQKITTLADPTNAQDAATKTYVDTTAAGGITPLSSVNYATSTILPNSPVYTSPAEIITSTGGPGTLTIDGQTVSVSDRILLKDQSDNRENGIYSVTDDGATPGPNWVLTRSTDFNQAATPISAGTSIFVEIVSGASQSGSTWSLQTTVNTIDPLTDSVVWIQTGGSPSFTAGLGIDATQLTLGTIQTDISARLTYTGNDLDLNTVTVPFGGTGLTTITSGNVMVGQGTSAISATKAAPTGDFVGTTDTQTLTNKTITSNTNDITSRSLFVDSGSGQVSTFAAAVPSVGQVLTATGASTATWQNVGDVTLNGSQTITNKTITDNSNDVNSRALFVDSGAGIVSTFTAAVPSIGQVLTATGASTATWQNVGDVTLNGTQTLTNKTLTDNTNNITSRGMFTGSGTGTLSTYSAIAPLSGQVLTATSGTTATWQTPTVGDVTLNGVQTLTNKTMTSNTNELIARELFIDSGSASISTFAASVPSSGQVLTATSGTTATWQTPTVGDVTLNGVQTLTNKTITASTNDVTARGVFTNSGANTVSTFSAANPTSGQVLTATGATTATWQTPSSGLPTYTNTITVSPSNPDVSPNWTTLGAAITDAVSLVPTETNQVLIIMYPGIYTETTPITVPEWISISGQTSSQGVVVVRPTVPAPVGAVLVLNGNVRLYGFVIDGFDGAAANATIGISSIGGSFGSIDYCNNITSRNCTDAAFKVTGTSAQFSKVLSLTNCSALVTIGFPFVMSVGYECDLGAVLSGSGSTASGFLSGDGGFLDTAFFCHNDFSYMDLESTKISSVNIGMNIGTGVSSNNNDEYSFARIQDCTVGFFTTTGLILNLKSSVELFGFLLENNTGIFPNQIDVLTLNPSAPADPNKYFVFGSTFQRQRIIFAGDPTNPFITAGVVSDITEGRSRTTILGDITLDQAGSDFSMGQGVGNTTAMLILEDNGGVFTDIIKSLTQDNPNPFLCDLGTTSVIDLASAPATIDGVLPTLGVSRVLVKDGSTANPGTTSVDNGIYVWNGVGLAMTRASDFLIGLVETHQIHFAIDLGTDNYGSRWSPDPSTYPAGTFTIGTNAWGVESTSKSMFPTTFVNDDAFYIGNIAFRLFPGIELAITAPLTTSSGTSVDVIVWEFFNGVSWETQSLMSTNIVSPYQSFANETVSFGQTFLQYETKKYNYRFGDQSGWIPTAVNGVSAYWIRARIIDAANITQIPIIESVNLGTNSTKVNKVGFEEYFGEGRSRKKISIDTRSMTLTGVGNPTNQNLIAAIDGADQVRLNIRDNVFTPNANIGLGHLFVLPTNIDTSFTMRMTVYFIQTAAGVGDVAFKVNYVLTDDNSIINPSGTPNTQLKTTDIVLTTVTGTAGQQQRGVLELDVSNYIAGQNVFWFNFFRIGSDLGDTYASNINVIVFEIDYVIWNNGKDLQL